MTGHERATSKKTPNVQHPNVEQRSRSLAESSAAAREAAIEAPTIIAIGDIVRLRAELDWWNDAT